MIEELVEASKHLNGALERYLSACATIHSSCVNRNWMQLDSTLRDLSDRVINELASVSTYEIKLRTARTTISRARNCFTTMTPINTLPDELLTRIFYLALNMEPCAVEDPLSGHEYIRVPEYPDLLSHVCSRWRRVSTSSPALWSHIDLAPCDRLHQRLVDRAEIFANRAGDLPLYIHLVRSQHHPECSHRPYQTSEQFLESVSTRIKYLELPTRDNDNSDNIDILDSCFWICKPGILTELTITDYMRPCFIFPRDNVPDHVRGVLPLGQSYEFLENLWHHVTVLRLCRLFPYWTSKAYHGLIELRLTVSGTAGLLTISESQLVAILSSSPQLRILHLHLDTEITDQLPRNTLITPIHLGDLRVASFVFRDPEQAGRLLRWLAPGSIPLQVSISVSDRFKLGQFLPNSDVKDFFARCTITRFRLLHVHIFSYHTVLELLDQLPYLRVFALQYSNCRLDPRPAGTPELQPESQLEEHNALAMPGRLERFYMLYCHSSLDGLQWLVEKRLAQAFTLWGCTLSQGTDPWAASTAQVDEILKSSPGVEFIAGDKPNPSNDWD